MVAGLPREVAEPKEPVRDRVRDPGPARERDALVEDVLGVLDLLQRNNVKKVGLLARPSAK